MLKKLFYYDFRALGRTMIPTVLCTFGISVLASILFSVYYATGEMDLFSAVDSLIFIVQILLLLVLAYSLLLIYIFYISRIRTHMYGDEGYLTLVLPASPRQHILSKVLSGSIWGLIHTIVVFLSIFLVLIVPLFFSQEMTGNVGGSEVGTQSIGSIWATLAVICMLIHIIVSFFANYLLIFAAVSVGHILCNRGRMLISILFFFGVNIATGMLTTIVSLSFDPVLYYDASQHAMKNGDIYLFCSSLTNLMVTVATAILMYLLSVHLLKKKINLE